MTGDANVELSPTYAPTGLHLGPVTRWLLHMVGPGHADDPPRGACGVSLSGDAPRFLADWPSSFDVCLRCAVAHVQRLGGRIMELEGGME